MIAPRGIFVKVAAQSFLLIAAIGVTSTHGAEFSGWTTNQDCRWRRLAVPANGQAGFTLMGPPSTGITFSNLLSDEHSLTNRNLLSGSGVAAGDVDGDGLVDLYFCGLDNHNVLYRNLGGWKFEDITETAGVACANQYSTAAVLADLDGDGDLDLLVNALGGGTRVFENQGQWKFKEITDALGVRSKTGSMSMALADVDGNGTLDLYVANFRPDTIRDEPTTRFQGQLINGRKVITSINGRPASLPEYTNRFALSPTGSVLEFGEEDVLYLNDGKGHLQPVSFTGGSFLDEEGKPLSEPPRDWGLAVQFHDLNGDGAPDIYVCNDLFTPDRIWINDGKGHFRALPRLALRNTSTFSMGVDFADIDRDGHVDFFVVDMLSRDFQKRQVQISDSPGVVSPLGLIDNRPQVLRNNLQINRGDGTFAEATYFAGLEASEWSWGPIFLDVDLDGFEDLLISNGQLRDFQNADMANRIEQLRIGRQFNRNELLKLMKSYPSLETRNVAFRNRGDWTFEEKGTEWHFDTPGISQGMCLADLDGDGDLEVVVNNLNGAAGVYRNDISAPRIAVRLNGRPPNTKGIGARISIHNGAVRLQEQEMIAGGRYLSGDDAVRTFAAGTSKSDLRIEVRWRGGAQTVIAGVKPDCLYEINEPSNLSPRAAPIVEPQPIFEDVSALLGHRHHEDFFDDFERQPLLPNKLSQLGPGIAWHDFDGDGWDDLIIGSGRGGQLAVFRNNGKGGFTPVSEPPFDKIVSRDQTGILGTEFGFLVGAANYEDGLTNGGCIRVYDVKRKASGDSILGQSFSAGPLALADIDGDGDLDLFVGGRCAAGRYPEPVDSLLLRNEHGKFVVQQRFEKLGLISGAVFSDVNGDGKPDLVLASDWGPVRVFFNDGGQFKESTRELGLDKYVGWWNGVTTADIDGDGRMDIIASNWGLNTRYRTDRFHPRRVYYGDLEGNGTVNVIEASFDGSRGAEVVERGLRVMGAAFPFLRDKFGSYEAYGKATLPEIFGEKLPQMRHLEINTLASMLFLNRGDRFEGRPLPREAQMAPAFAVCVGDFDGDGYDDVFLSQNFFAVNPESSRADAGRGLWLKGGVVGELKAVSGHESGVLVYGEQRGAALGDFDCDGRIDLAVTQNGAETKLYRNRRARPGLRLILKGPAGNAQAIGTKIRALCGGEAGRIREIHAGGGYWSQDSAVQVLTAPKPITGLAIRWPNGRTNTYEISPTAREIRIDLEKGVTASR